MSKIAEELTVLVLTLNEEPNIGRVLQRLTWAPKILAIDSGSTDRTLEIIRSFPQASVHHRDFDTHAAQWNYGLDLVQTTWVLGIDADYLLSEELLTELQELTASSPVGYSAEFDYCIFGRPLTAALLPPRCILFRKDAGRFFDDGHTQRLRLTGTEAALRGKILHDDRKPLARWLRNQAAYAELEARKLHSTPFRELGLADRLRSLIVVAPIIVPLYCLTAKLGVLDGWRGIYYALQRCLAEVLLALQLIELRCGVVLSKMKFD